jgi:hypothetical protein
MVHTQAGVLQEENEQEEEKVPQQTELVSNSTPTQLVAAIDHLTRILEQINQKSAPAKVVKAVDLGYFYPDAPVTYSTRTTMVYENKTYYRDVYSFCNRLANLTSFKKLDDIKECIDSALLREASTW